MTKKPTYYEQLKDPRWQRKRLEVMERDGFECVVCGSGEKTLNVHHGYYEKGLAPWEYDSQTLWTICEDCHKAIELWRLVINRSIGAIDPSDLPKVFGLILGGRMTINTELSYKRQIDGKEISQTTANVISGIASAFVAEVDCYRAIDVSEEAEKILKEKGNIDGRSMYEICKRMNVYGNQVAK